MASGKAGLHHRSGWRGRKSWATLPSKPLPWADDRLDQYGLEAGDDMQASDHLIVVADLRKHDRPGTKPAKQLKRID